MKLVLALMLGLGGFAAPPLSAQAAVEKPAELRLTKHAERRMEQRGVTRAQFDAAVARGEKFRYFHDGKWKTGYYDESTGVFIAADGAAVLTVISGATPSYIRRLKRAKPR